MKQKIKNQFKRIYFAFKIRSVRFSFFIRLIRRCNEFTRKQKYKYTRRMACSRLRYNRIVGGVFDNGRAYKTFRT